MLCTYIALFYLLAFKALYTASYSPIHTHTDGGAAMQLANTHQEQLSWGSVRILLHFLSLDFYFVAPSPYFLSLVMFTQLYPRCPSFVSKQSSNRETGCLKISKRTRRRKKTKT
ncbi:hypothetical protein EXN66_Car016323 [Channa argus]|uniref:Uncharacterized protein n=1 Tax=Channa argus TaxID=215402 RepID=A0A6G1QEU0_CHAAH|nr:hypothetical protein EXN66_Car016323 [Channa argus]